MFDATITGTALEMIASSLSATADYCLGSASKADKLRDAYRHVNTAATMLCNLLDDLEEDTDFVPEVPDIEE